MPVSQETKTHIRWGIAGPGRAAARFAQGLHAVPAASIQAVWGRNPEKTQAYAARFNLPQPVASLAELLAAPVDAIYVSTHPDTHAYI